jgi:hypothetical protein
MVNDPYERIDAQLNRAEPRLARVFRTAVDQLRAALDLELVAVLLESGRVEELLDMLRDVAAQVGAASNVVFVDAGRETAEFLRTADVARIAFDVVNIRAVQQMQVNQLELIRDFNEQQREVVRLVVADGIQQGLGPREQARNFRSVVGLNDRQASAVLNYRRLLERVGNSEYSRGQQREALTRALRDGRGDRSVEAAVRVGRPLKPEQIDRMVEAYHRRYIKYRAEVIARTEALRSVHQGNEEAYQQAIELGQIDPAQIEEKWNSARDRRVRDSHRLLNGKTKGLGGYWQGLWGKLRFPGDPEAPARETIQCRCIVTRRIRDLSDITP